MVIEVGKPDYYVVLKKRRKTVAQYLAQQDVDTKKKLQSLYEALEVEHLVSNTFRQEAEDYLAAIEVKKKAEKKKPSTPKKEEKADEGQEKAEEKKPEPKKSKRRPRRSSKKKTIKSNKKEQGDEDAAKQ